MLFKYFSKKLLSNKSVLNYCIDSFLNKMKYYILKSELKL